jgi:hypothetical protein
MFPLEASYRPRLRPVARRTRDVANHAFSPAAREGFRTATAVVALGELAPADLLRAVWAALEAPDERWIVVAETEASASNALRVPQLRNTSRFCGRSPAAPTIANAGRPPARAARTDGDRSVHRDDRDLRDWAATPRRRSAVRNRSREWPIDRRVPATDRGHEERTWSAECC